MTKVCVIGAGCSGITTAKRLKEHGIDYDQLEQLPQPQRARSAPVE